MNQFLYVHHFFVIVSNRFCLCFRTPEECFMEFAVKSEEASPGGGKIDKADMRDCFRRLRDNDDIKELLQI